MNQRSTLLLEHHLKELKLSSFLREYGKMATQCAAEGVDHPQYLLRLAERVVETVGQRPYLEFFQPEVVMYPRDPRWVAGCLGMHCTKGSMDSTLRRYALLDFRTTSHTNARSVAGTGPSN